VKWDRDSSGFMRTVCGKGKGKLGNVSAIPGWWEKGMRLAGLPVDSYEIVEGPGRGVTLFRQAVIRHH